MFVYCCFQAKCKKAKSEIRDLPSACCEDSVAQRNACVPCFGRVMTLRTISSSGVVGPIILVHIRKPVSFRFVSFCYRFHSYRSVVHFLPKTRMRIVHTYASYRVKLFDFRKLSCRSSFTMIINRGWKVLAMDLYPSAYCLSRDISGNALLLAISSFSRIGRLCAGLLSCCSPCAFFCWLMPLSGH